MESFFATNSRVADEESTEIVLVNPRAGSGAALRNRQCWKRCLSGSYEVVTGANAAETERLAAEATRQGVRRLSVVGGDGTIHHACNGYLSVTNSRTQLRIIPFGTANDYAASLRLHARQVGRESFEVDVGQLRCGDFKRYFVNVAGLGLTARAAALSRSSKWFPSRIRYLAGLLRTMTHDWQYSEIRLQLDDSSPATRQLLTTNIAIGQREGSFLLAPEARLDDRFFEVLLAGNLRRRDVARYLPGIMLGQLPQSDPRIQYQQCSRLTLDCTAPLPFHLDGEVYGAGCLDTRYTTFITSTQRMTVSLAGPSG